MEIKIETEYTRIERMALIEKAIVEMEKHGYGELNISFRNHQVVGCALNKPCIWGNTAEVWY